MKLNAKLALIICILLAAVLAVSACKSEEELASAYGSEPTVISPDVNINQEAVKAPPTLNVKGSGKVTLTPDMVKVYIEIYTEASAPDEAQSKNAELTGAVTAAILAKGVKDTDIQTQEAYLNEVYDYDKSPVVVVGYRMNTVLLVTVRDVASVGSVIGEAVAAGATGTYGLTFDVSDTSDAYGKALQAAVSDAAAKAQAMAEALGVGIYVVPVSVSESSVSQAIEYDVARDMAAAEEATASNAVDMPVSTGEITVTASVSVAYEMYEPPVQ